MLLPYEYIGASACGALLPSLLLAPGPQSLLKETGVQKSCTLYVSPLLQDGPNLILSRLPTGAQSVVSGRYPEEVLE